MVVNSIQDIDGMPATSNIVAPPPDSQSTPTPKEPEPGTPKPSTIKIQSPPAAKTEEKKDDKAVLALRQVSQEAASKAKTKTDDKKPEEEAKEESKQEESNDELSPSARRGHRGSVAPELPDTAPDSPKVAKRPPLIPEIAAVSSANFHADNAEMLGLVEHHRGSIISATDKEEQDKVVKDIRQSITAADSSGNLDALRKEAAEKAKDGTIEEVATPLEEDVKAVATETKDDTKEDTKEDKEEAKDDTKEDTKDDAKPGEAKE